MSALARLSGLKEEYGIQNFNDLLRQSSDYPLVADRVETLQLNTGRRCNLSCEHCHMEAGPLRTEMMTKPVFEKCLKAAKTAPGITTIDITGGSPEMNPHLEWFVSKASKLGKRLIVRSNISILAENEYSKFMDVYAANGVEICASLPCYGRENVDKQRGKGVYDICVRALKELNAKGYGETGSGLVLNLVYNPGGAFLPGSQNQLETDYKNNLRKEHGIFFNSLLCLANMPVGRFFNRLDAENTLNEYMNELACHYNPGTISNLMCRNTISVSWAGGLYDCDFNLALGLGVKCENSTDIDSFDAAELDSREIVTHNHCYGCAAGSGSSCRGSIV